MSTNKESQQKKAPVIQINYETMGVVILSTI